MGQGRNKRRKSPSGKYAGHEITSLNEPTETIFELEELEKRLEMQRLPLESGTCDIQEAGCYADGCEGNYCVEYCAGNTCADLCWCDDGHCYEWCNPDCGGDLCFEYCQGDGCGAQLY